MSYKLTPLGCWKRMAYLLSDCSLRRHAECLFCFFQKILSSLALYTLTQYSLLPGSLIHPATFHPLSSQDSFLPLHITSQATLLSLFSPLSVSPVLQETSYIILTIQRKTQSYSAALSLSLPHNNYIRYPAITVPLPWLTPLSF